MKTIYKYPLEIRDSQLIELPTRAEILSVGIQSNHIMLWAMVDTHEVMSTRRIRIVGTGHPFEQPFVATHFIGTVMTDGGQYVWHVFEVV